MPVLNFPAQLGWSTLYKSQNFILIIISVFISDVGGVMEPVEAKELVIF